MIVSFLRIIISNYTPLLIIFSFIIIHFLYLYFSTWLFSINKNYEHLTFIISTLSAAATTFAAVTAAILVQNWKQQHNLSLASKLISNIWDLHTNFTTEIYKLNYLKVTDLHKDDYEKIYSNLIQITVPIRSKIEQLKILLEIQIDDKNLEKLEEYLYFLQNFYPWSSIEFLEFRNNKHGFINEFEYVNSALLDVLKTYLTAE